MNFDVVSIGAATVDVFAKSASFSLQNDLLQLPSSSKIEITDSLICSGGGATNSSVAFSRLGLKSATVSLIGRDPLSAYVLNELKQDDVTSFITQATAPTDFSVILIAPDGARTILTNRGSTSLSPRHIPWTKIKKTRWFYITSLEGNFDVLEKLIGFAREHDIKISLNPGNRELTHPSLLKPFLKYVDFLLLNKTESEVLTRLRLTDHRYWPQLLSTQVPIIAVTHGRDGAYVTDSTHNYYSPIINTKPIDETGAGDAFGSTFVAALVYGHSLDVALSWAIRNSASVVSAIGAKPGLLKLSQIKKYASQA